MRALPAPPTNFSLALRLAFGTPEISYMKTFERRAGSGAAAPAGCKASPLAELPPLEQLTKEW